MSADFIVDQVARDASRDALAAIEAHERVCAEKAIAAQLWRADTSAKLEDIKKKISGFYNRLWATCGALILILLSVIGWLLTHPRAGL